MKRQWASLLALGLIAAATPVAAQSQIGVGSGREDGYQRPPPPPRDSSDRDSSEYDRGEIPRHRGEVDSVIIDDEESTPIHINPGAGPLSCPPGQHLRSLGATRQCVPDAPPAAAPAPAR